MSNGELKALFGFNPLGCLRRAPPWVYMQLLKILFELEAILHRLVDELQELLPDLIKKPAGDSKVLESLGEPPK